MTAPPGVSIIVPFLDEERFLEDAVESVFAQSYDSWELLLVDDGSSDASTEIAREYAARRAARVSYLRHDGGVNRGMSASRNLALRHASGEYVSFLDADDVWVERKLEEQLELLQSDTDAAMILGAAEWWYSWTGRNEDAGRDHVWSPFGEGRLDGVRALTSLLRNPAPTTTISLVRREAAVRVGGFEEGFRGMHEDQAFFAKVCLASPVIASNRCWYRWRQHPDSCCAASAEAGAWTWQRRRFYGWLTYMLRRANVDDRELWRELAEEPVEVGSAAGGGGRRRRHRLARVSRFGRRRPVPPVGRVDLGDLRRTEPISREWGFDRGRPIDRYYIEAFLARRAEDIHGRVLEIGDDTYTRRFGGHRVALADVLNSREHPGATIVADLASADHVPNDAFDCVVVTQTLQLIFDVGAAIRTVHRILKPGGVVLATVPGITHIGDSAWGSQWQWSFTTHSVATLFEEAFGTGNVEVGAHGNVLAAIAFLEGLAAEELRPTELDVTDPAYEVLITARAMKAASRTSAR